MRQIAAITEARASLTLEELQHEKNLRDEQIAAIRSESRLIELLMGPKRAAKQAAAPRGPAHLAQSFTPSTAFQLGGN